jgi:hypothetical protein
MIQKNGPKAAFPQAASGFRGKLPWAASTTQNHNSVCFGSFLKWAWRDLFVLHEDVKDPYLAASTSTWMTAHFPESMARLMAVLRPAGSETRSPMAPMDRAIRSKRVFHLLDPVFQGIFRRCFRIQKRKRVGFNGYRGIVAQHDKNDRQVQPNAGFDFPLTQAHGAVPHDGVDLPVRKGRFGPDGVG